MADDPEKPKRTTSFAKSLDDPALARADRLADEFDRAKARPERPLEKRAKDAGLPTHAPGAKPPPPRPNTPGADASDRQAFNRRQAALNRADRAKNRLKQQKPLGLENDRDKDKDDRDR